MKLTDEQKRIVIIVLIVIVALYLFGLYNSKEPYDQVPIGGSYGQVQNEIYQWPYPNPLDFMNVPRRYAKYSRDGKLFFD